MRRWCAYFFRDLKLPKAPQRCVASDRANSQRTNSRSEHDESQWNEVQNEAARARRARRASHECSGRVQPRRRSSQDFLRCNRSNLIAAHALCWQATLATFHLMRLKHVCIGREMPAQATGRVSAKWEDSTACNTDSTPPGFVNWA